MNPVAPRAMFFFDGFNLFHSVERALLVAPFEPMKWLNLTSLAVERRGKLGHGLLEVVLALQLRRINRVRA